MGSPFLEKIRDYESRAGEYPGFDAPETGGTKLHHAGLNGDWLNEKNIKFIFPGGFSTNGKEIEGFMFQGELYRKR